jgi:hypothetical protein
MFTAIAFVAGAILSYYVTEHYSLAAVKAEVAKLEAEGVVEAKSILARIKAAL